MGLYCAILLVTMVDMAILFRLGNPEWRPVAVGYLGLLLMGGCFISVGLLISSLTKNQIVAAILAFVLILGTFIIPPYLGAVGWKLTREQVAKLDAASELPSAYPYWHQVQFADRNPPPIQTPS